jgi:hypothetical protein
MRTGRICEFVELPSRDVVFFGREKARDVDHCRRGKRHVIGEGRRDVD